MSAASEISALVAERGFASLKKPVIRVTTPDVNIPYSPALEKQLYPGTADIVTAVNKLQ
jgi:pyruvate dehydrogenase E1 component beta subunit